MSVTEFAGVTKDKDRGITSKGELYEFWTEEGAHVYPQHRLQAPDL